jgi:hypothetical protein
VGDTSKSPPQSPSLAHRPLKDLTNEGQVKKLTQAYSGPVSSADQTHTSTSSSAGEVKPDSGGAGYVSMPALASGQPEKGEVGENGTRERAATYSVLETVRQQQQQQDGDFIEQLDDDVLDPTLLGIREGKSEKISPSSSTKSKNALCCQSSACVVPRSKQSSSAQKELLSSPKSSERKRGKEKMGTIGMLCKQSISFDLGVSLRASSPDPAGTRSTSKPRPQSAESITASPLTPPQGGAEGGAKTKVRPSSTGSEGDAGSAAGGEHGDKKKQRSRFLDSSWLQKPKKFFKVSK